jgi:pseudouridine synthase
MKTRLQRFLADCGVASRRECEEMILAGRVRVNGEVHTKMPVMIEPGRDVVTVDDVEVGGEYAGEEGGLKEQEKVYFLLNKPKGILVTNYDPSERKTVGELMTGVKQRVFPVGRLDMDARGALIMTNDGELANRLTHPRYGVEKTFVVEVDGRVGHDDLEKIKRGMWLGPLPSERPGGQGAVKTERFKVKLVGRERGRTILEVTISEGKNREIRRVMARIGHVVRDLNRVAIADRVTIKGLEVGEFRPLTEAEVKWLFKASSPEFHTQQKAATQAWYEAKEMEKERKRLKAETQNATLKTQNKERPSPETRERKEFRPRPARKGKKPFVPPSGRNAGKALGGNFIGRQRAEREGRVPKPEGSVGEGQHPLGDDAQFDE